MGLKTHGRAGLTSTSDAKLKEVAAPLGGGTDEPSLGEKTTEAIRLEHNYGAHNYHPIPVVRLERVDAS
jgi:hypothetical protein